MVGYRLWGRRYVPVQSEPEAGLAGELPSEMLGVSLRPEGELLRVRSLATGEDYVWDTEFRPRIAMEAEARRAAEQRAKVAEAESARLKALLAEERTLPPQPRLIGSILWRGRQERGLVWFRPPLPEP